MAAMAGGGTITRVPQGSCHGYLVPTVLTCMI